MDQYQTNGNVAAQGKPTERNDLVGFRDRITKVSEDILDLYLMMEKVADVNFGSQLLGGTESASPPVGQTTADTLQELERRVTRLRQQCSRF